MDLSKITEIAYKVDRAYLESVGDSAPEWAALTEPEKSSFADSVQGAMSQDVPINEDKVEYSRACIMKAIAVGLSGVPDTIQAENGKTTLAYIGRRDEIKDAIYNTGIWTKGQAKGVPDVLARKMAKLHPDAYAIVATQPSEDVIIHDMKSDEESTRDQDARDQIYSMTDIESIKGFMERNFNQGLHHTIKKVETARERAVELIDRFGMPE